MLGDTSIYRNRRIKDYRNKHGPARMASNDLKLIPRILKDDTEIDFEKSIDNVHSKMLQRNRILSDTQVKLRVLIEVTLVRVNDFIQPNVINLPDLRDSSSDSAGSSLAQSIAESNASSSSSSDSAESTSPQQQSSTDSAGGNPAQSPDSDGSSSAGDSDDEFMELDPESRIPDTLLSGTREFVKYVDQMREEMLAIFSLASQNFPTHRDAKFAFARILRAAGVWRRREFKNIIATV